MVYHKRKPLKLSKGQVVVLTVLSFLEKNFWKLFIQYLLYCVPLFFTILIRESDLKKYSVTEWLIIFLSPVILTTCTFLKENFFNKSKKEELIDNRVIFETTSQAIFDIREVLYHIDHREMNYLKESLARIQRIIELKLKQNDISVGEISVNFMEKQGDCLKIKEIDVKTSRHDTGVLPLTQRQPGAPQAYLDNKIKYINNTNARNYKEFFKNKRYNSLFSIPVCDSSKCVFGVINVDSSEKDQFVNLEFITETLKPSIEPIIYLIELNHFINKYKVENSESSLKG